MFDKRTDIVWPVIRMLFCVNLFDITPNPVNFQSRSQRSLAETVFKHFQINNTNTFSSQPLQGTVINYRPSSLDWSGCWHDTNLKYSVHQIHTAASAIAKCGEHAPTHEARSFKYQRLSFDVILPEQFFESKRPGERGEKRREMRPPCTSQRLTYLMHRVSREIEWMIDRNLFKRLGKTLSGSSK